jgi:hypothetical protein
MGKFRLISPLLISAVLLSGCSKSSNDSDEIKIAKAEACKSIMVEGIGGVSYANIVLFNNRQIVLFDKLAKLDEKYMDVSLAVHYGYLLANRQNLNNIVKVMAFFDATLSEAQISRAIKSNAQGACDIEIEEKKKDEEETQKDAEQLIKDLENGIDLTETESDILSEVEVRIKARGVDLGILIHESLKGIYKLCTQMSLEHLPEEIAKQVLQNTDTTMDEPQEFKYGPSMQKQFEKVINTHPKVKSIIDDLTRNIVHGEGDEIPEAENKLASFQEQLFFYVFGFLAAMGKDDPKEMLKVVYAVLADKKDDIERLFFPIVGSSVASLEQEFKYQQSKSSSTKTEVTKEPVSGEKTLSDLQEELDDAEDSEDYEKAVEIRDEIKRRFPNK